MSPSDTETIPKRPARRTNKRVTLFLHEDERRELLRRMADADEREVSRFVSSALGLAKQKEAA